MAQAYTCETKEYFWGETFITDRGLSIISDLSMPGLVEDQSEESETSSDENYHLSSTRLFDSYHEKAPRIASTLLTQVNQAYARESHQYPEFPLSRSGARRSSRRSTNVLESLEAKPESPRSSTSRTYATWPLRNETNQSSITNRLSAPTSRRPNPPRPNPAPFDTVPQIPSLQASSTPTPEIHSTTTTTTTTSSARSSCSPTKTVEETNHPPHLNEISYFDWSDDEGSDEDDHSGSLMRRLHIRSASAGKLGDVKASSLRRFFRYSKKS